MLVLETVLVMETCAYNREYTVYPVCVFDYPVPSPIRLFFVEDGCVQLSEV